MARVHEVDDAADDRLREYRSLTDVSLRRRQEPQWGLFMAESAKVIGRAVAAGFQPRSALTSSRWLPELTRLLAGHDVPIYLAADEVLHDLTGYRVHRGALAAMSRRPLPPLSDVLSGARRIVVLEGIVDHTNVGAAFRSIAALGFDGVVLDPTCADPLYRRSVRVSMGAVFSVPWTRATSWPASLDELRTAGFTLVGLSPRSPSDIAQFAADPPDRLAIMIGTEGDGLTVPALDRVDLSVQIPMAAGVDSLNMAAAAAVACYVLGATGNAKMDL